MKVAILGGGALGQTFGMMVHLNEHSLRVFDVNFEKLKKSTLSKYSDAVLCSDAEDCVKDAQVILICTPSFAVRDVLVAAKKELKNGVVIVNCSKGLEKDTMKFLTDVIKEEVPASVFVAELSGPAIAAEMALGVQTKVDLVCENDEAFNKAKEALENHYFKCVRNHDMHGVELGGIMKNVYALVSGIIDGASEGYSRNNTKAFILTEGMHEMSKLGVALGCKEETLKGLSGLGDLLTTSMSEDSRNRQFGRLLGSGKSIKEAMDIVGMVAEGYYATENIYSLAKKAKVSLPLLEAAYSFLYEKASLDDFLVKIVSSDTIEVS